MSQHSALILCILLRLANTPEYDSFLFSFHLSNESSCWNLLTLHCLSSLGVTMASCYCSLLSWPANIWLASVYPIPRTKSLTLNKCRRVSAHQLNANLKLSSRPPQRHLVAPFLLIVELTSVCPWPILLDVGAVDPYQLYPRELSGREQYPGNLNISNVLHIV